MSKKHPVVAVTGSSGAGTTTVKVAFEHIFMREGVNPVVIEGDSYHRYNRAEMKVAMQEAEEDGNTSFSHFGPEANIFDKLEETFRTYGETGSCERRYYLHSDEEARPFGQQPGEFTPWETISAGTDLLFYEGLHGGIVTEDADVAKHVDLLIGVVPIVNLEWIQKIHRDCEQRGYSAEAVTDTILRRIEAGNQCHVRIAQRGRKRGHDVAAAGAVFVLVQCIGQVIGVLTGERRRLRCNTLAFRAVTRDTGGSRGNR